MHDLTTPVNASLKFVSDIDEAMNTAVEIKSTTKSPLLFECSGEKTDESAV